MRLRVKVIARAKKERVESCPDCLRVYLNEPALEGRANKKLIEILAKYLRVKKYNIDIIKGLKQRDKVVEISEAC